MRDLIDLVVNPPALEEAKKKRKKRRAPKYAYSAPRVWGLPIGYGSSEVSDCGDGGGGGGE